MPVAKYRYRVCPTCHNPHGFRSVNGPFLRAQRERAGMDVRYLADALGVSRQFLSRVETNRAVCPERIRVAYERLGDTVTPRTRQ